MIFTTTFPVVIVVDTFPRIRSECISLDRLMDNVVEFRYNRVRIFYLFHPHGLPDFLLNQIKVNQALSGGTHIRCLPKRSICLSIPILFLNLTYRPTSYSSLGSSLIAFNNCDSHRLGITSLPSSLVFIKLILMNNKLTLVFDCLISASRARMLRTYWHRSLQFLN
jgi:hypothetical protein